MSHARRADDSTRNVSDRVRKVSVSMPDSLIRRVKERVGSGSFSRYVTEAVMRQLRMDNLDDLIADYVSRHGPLPQEALEEAEKALCELEAKWAEEGL
jgi:Arc/MetJ-type ribon-helix-helix transcriptional regulator